MNGMLRALCGALVVTCPATALAQSIAPAPAVLPVTEPVTGTTAMIVGGPKTSVLRAGTQIALKTSEPLTTEGKKLRVGQRFQLEVADAVTLDGQTVIPIGSPVTGEITDVRNKGMWGKSGRINARVLYVRVNGRQVRLTGQIDDKGVTGTAGVVAAIAFIPIAGFITTGTSARIPLGSAVSAFLDEDLTVSFAAAAAPEPMIVAPTTPLASVAPATTPMIPEAATTPK